MAGEAVQNAGAQTVVTEASIIDRIAEAHRHLAPPEGAFTVEDYLERVKARGASVKHNTALRALKAEMAAGQLAGAKFVTGDRERWYFWETPDLRTGNGSR